MLLHLSFYLYAFTIPLESLNISLDLGPISIARFSGLMVIAFSMVNVRRSYSKPTLHLWFFLLYLVFYVARGLFIPSDFTSAATTGLFTIVQLLVFFWIASNLLQDETFSKRVLLAYSTGAAFMTAAAMLGVPGFSHAELINFQGSRTTAVGANPNYLAAVLGLAAVILAGMILNKRIRGFVKIGLILMITVILGMIIQTGSRSGLIGLILGMTCYVWPSGLTRRKLVPIALVICAFVSCGYLLLHDPDFMVRLSSTISTGDTSGRDVIYASGLSMVYERPLLGWGPVAYQSELAVRTREGFAMRDSHNLLLHLLLEGGLLGTLIFVTALALCARSAWKSRGGALGIMIPALVVTLFIELQAATWMTTKPLWLVLALCVGAEKGVQATRLAASRRTDQRGQNFARFYSV